MWGWGPEQKTKEEAAVISMRERMEVVPEWEQRKRER